MQAAALSVVPTDLETCFSPDEDCDTKLLSFIKTAHHTIDMAIYNITLTDLGTLLQNAKQRGIKIRLVVDRREAAGPSSIAKDLASQGIPLRIGHVSGIMHDKFTIIDGQAIETGSFNYTDAAAHRNAENQIYLYSQQVVDRYADAFEKLWDDAAKSKPVTED
jgi:phosphatidylserine/phosphatidylglycerophosphate/cardiolipin synthase-like enzyme